MTDQRRGTRFHPPPAFEVGDRVIHIVLQCAVPEGTVTKREWSAAGWVYGVLWDEGPGEPEEAVGSRRNRDNHGFIARWREAQLQRVGEGE